MNNKTLFIIFFLVGVALFLVLVGLATLIESGKSQKTDDTTATVNRTVTGTCITYHSVIKMSQKTDCFPDTAHGGGRMQPY